jgi:Ca-activated chloride channel homolog
MAASSGTSIAGRSPDPARRRRGEGTVSEIRRAGSPLVSAAAVLCLLAAPHAQERPTGQGFSFTTGVELISVSVTVTDENGRFVSGLKRDDFSVSENGQPQTVSQFDAERVPVSLGIALDTSGSMLGEKIVAAQAALNRFLFDLLGPQDQVFLYRFDSRPDLVQAWTTDRQDVSRALGSVKPLGGTALYDTVADAIPLAQNGTNRKKALVIISDGNDTSSHTRLPELRQLIRQSEVLVYAVGIDAATGTDYSSHPTSSRPARVPVPSAFPGAPVVPQAPPRPQPPPARSTRSTSSSVDRVNPDALREITDDSGGRTEIISSPRDLDPATAGIADELSRQYFLGYVSTLPKDGQWHQIEVRVRGGRYTVRARKGFIAN